MTYFELATYICRKAIGSKYFNFAAEGDVYDLNDKTIKDYPALLVSGVGPHTDTGKFMRYRISLFYFDRLTSDDSNSTLIYSQGIELLKNLINDLRHDEYILRVSDEIQYVPFSGVEAQVLSDRTCGVYATLDLTVKNNTTCFLS